MFAMQVAAMKGSGGVLTSLFHYARMWEDVGVRSVCLYRGPAATALRAGGVAVIDAPAGLDWPIYALTPGFARLRRQIRAHGGRDPDCIMVHSDRMLRAMRHMFPAAVILTRCHTDKTKHKRDADIVVTLNPDQHRRVTQELAGSRARTFMLGHPFVLESPPAPAADGPPRVNYVARFVPEKDPATFAHAVTRLRTRPLPAIRLVGDGPLAGDIRNILAGTGIDAEFVGWRSRPFDDFTRNDILVLPSTWEGLPWLLLEAQARGIPTIASDIPGNRLALGDGAYGDLFSPGDAAQLASRLDAALHDLADLRAKAERARRDLPQRFGPKAFWHGLQHAIQTVLDAERSVARP